MVVQLEWGRSLIMGNRNEKSYEIKTECICPRCGKEFHKNVFYTGKLPAKYFCHTCDHMAMVVSETTRCSNLHILRR